MAENEIRIKDLPSTQQINETDDVIVLDNATDGTRKLQGKVLLDMIHSAMAKGTANGAVASFTDGADNIPMTDLVVSIEPQQSGSGDPSPTNIRPISGWTACNESVCGENLFNKDASDKAISEYLNHNTGTTIASDNWNTSGYIPAKQNQNYVLSGYNNLAPSNFEICFYDSNKTFISGLNQNTFTFTSPSGTAYIRIDYKKVDENTVQLQFGSTPSSYVPYATPHTYTINFVDGSSPLTVYGGTLDVLSGLLTVDRGQFTIDENQQYITIQSSESYGTVFRMVTGQSCIQNDTQISNQFKFDNNAWQINPNRIGTFVLGSEGNLYVQAPPSVGTTVDAFRTWLTSHNIQINYELATPQTYQLTPTEVKSLLGVNNIFSDTGDILNAEYVRDTTTIINQILARLDALEG